jgi:hypothetical protein
MACSDGLCVDHWQGIIRTWRLEHEQRGNERMYGAHPAVAPDQQSVRIALCAPRRNTVRRLACMHCGRYAWLHHLGTSTLQVAKDAAVWGDIHRVQPVRRYRAPQRLRPLLLSFALAARRDGQPEFTTLSVFCCGKITDNIGVFAQWTHDTYDHQDDTGKWQGHSHVDQVDMRFADHFIDLHRDLI